MLRATVTACTQQVEKMVKGAAPLRLITHTRQSLAELVRLSIVRNHEGLVRGELLGLAFQLT